MLSFKQVFKHYYYKIKFMYEIILLPNSNFVSKIIFLLINLIIFMINLIYLNSNYK